ncbi:protein TAPETUM DETERMINANT 1 [Manihot esculenta]|uniref:Uncharacterized protein n=1 Tax=Manihot esculenta TaxID=3983 RepID=A0A251KPM5_MANES|nr:protein TAPETUM DETERMINANT 1 [Manihot esculenta]XP_021615442.1 protein TAPETUM DETERMINANT 1 [Manihot esculenta]XP_021615443.1 protein TAPETUM DETERMINANT 1 [Manihot esculenta]OAY47993.1 hypothetical protein MANES_06G122700v8 [Manihot esculenta]OAY47994.1 hypothetical protein MANES_06G122700v8 [Manihot esculenta]
MRAFSKGRIAAVLVLLFSLILLSMPLYSTGTSYIEGRSTGSINSVSKGGNYTLFSPHRKLLRRSLAIVEPVRIAEKCTKADILIIQGATPPLPSGIPTYTVEIMNACASGCDISGIHLTCGWFSSANPINPNIFKRLSYNDCLVNDGKPLAVGGTISFVYASTYLYPMSVSSVFC